MPVHVIGIFVRLSLKLSNEQCHLRDRPPLLSRSMPELFYSMPKSDRCLVVIVFDMISIHTSLYTIGNSTRRCSEGVNNGSSSRSCSPKNCYGHWI